MEIGNSPMREKWRNKLQEIEINLKDDTERNDQESLKNFTRYIKGGFQEQVRNDIIKLFHGE